MDRNDARFRGSIAGCLITCIDTYTGRIVGYGFASESLPEFTLKLIRATRKNEVIEVDHTRLQLKLLERHSGDLEQ